MRKLHLDVTVGHTEVCFSGAAQPLAAISSLSAFGALMLARQVTAAPEQQLRKLPVGNGRLVEVPVTVKGSRALMKVYTDIRALVDDPRVCYSMGLEPTIALVSQ